MDRESTAAGLGRFTLPWSHLLVLSLWIWAVWSCAEHWKGNPNYSYGWVVPFLVAGFGLRRYLQLDRAALIGSTAIAPRSGLVQLLAGAGVALLAFGLEYAREEVWHQEVVLWSICLLTVAATLAVFQIRGGKALLRAELFPVLFFLTAVPWPPRLEQPIVSGLMRWVAATTTELLHWLGVEAQMAGAAIALPTGLVGISEACSGVRSLQAGIMFGLAMGEWFLLKPLRRVILLFIAIGLALLTNLIRTLALSLEAERHGLAAVDRVHDAIGNVMITSLIVGIWLVGRVLAGRRLDGRRLDRVSPYREIRDRLFVRGSIFSAWPLFRIVAVSLLIGIFAAHGLEAWSEAKERMQTAPFFVVRPNDSNHLQRIPAEIWNELRPTTGEQIHRVSSELPGGSADCFHFFWKPSPWNRFALVHRPDICMPGIGWISVGSPESIELELNGHRLNCYLFRFTRGNAYALELWGLWRNGESVSLDYDAAQALGAAVAPPALRLGGKRRSATEIVACSVIGDGSSPPPEIAVALLQSVFQYKDHE